MLAPKFTLRQLLIAMIGFALVSALLGWTSKGSIVAYGLGLAIISLFIPMIVYAFAFWGCRIFGSFFSKRDIPAGKPTPPIRGNS